MLETLLLILTLVAMSDCISLDPFQTDFSISVQRNFTGEAGLCVIAYCHFTFSPNILSKPLNRTWFKGDPHNPSVEVPCFDSNTNFESNMMGCNFELGNLVQGESDGEYRFKVEWGQGNVYIFPETVTITVKEPTQKPIMHIPTLTAEKRAKLSCQYPGYCIEPLANVVWTGIDGGKFAFEAFTVPGRQNSFSVMFFDPKPEHHNTNLTCTVIFHGNIHSETSVILEVKYAPRVLNGSHCFLWGDELTCVCISDGVPLPHIIWPLPLDVPFYYSIDTSGETYSVSTISISGNSHPISTAKCISWNEVGMAAMEIQIHSSNICISGSLTAPWIVCIISVLLNIIFFIAIMVICLRKRRGTKPPKDDKHVYMTIMKRQESLYDNVCPEKS